MRLKHSLMVWSVRIKKFLNRNFNPYYRDIRYLANVNEIVKELHIFETRLIKDHNKHLERNRTLSELKHQLDQDVTEFLTSSEKYKDIDLGTVTVFTSNRLKAAEKIYEDCLLTYIQNGKKKLVGQEDNIDFNLRFMLYSLCLVNCNLVKTNVYYKIDNKLKPLSHFFETLINDLSKEYDKPKFILIDPYMFFEKYSRIYKDYVFKHILNVSNFEILQ